MSHMLSYLLPVKDASFNDLLPEADRAPLADPERREALGLWDCSIPERTLGGPE